MINHNGKSITACSFPPNKVPAHSSIQGICLDMDGTLYDWRLFWARMVWSLLKEVVTGRFPLGDLKILYRLRQGTEKARQCSHSTSLRSAIVAEVVAASGSTPDQVSGLLEHWTGYLQPKVLSGLVDPSLRHLLTRLRLRGYRLGVYSDYPAQRKLEALAFPPTFFDAIVDSLSPDIDALKPHPKGFQEVCARMGLEPSAVIYLGDRLETDGAGASSAGMPFIHCKPSQPFAKQAPVTKYLLQWEKSAPTLKEVLCESSQDRCWICGGLFFRGYKSSTIPRMLDPDLVKVTDARYGMTARLLQCEDCDFIRADMQSAHQIEDLYRSMVDQEYQQSSGVRRSAFANILRLIRDQRPSAKSLLDVGAGTGMMCAEAQKAGFQTEGVEPSSWAVSEARRQGLRVHEGCFPHPDVGGRLFDVVTLCDVIEHVSRPVALLQAAHRCVNPDGLIVIVTPDVDSWAARIMGSHWWHFRPAHIGYFTPHTMAAALAVSGLTLERVESYAWRLPLGYLLERAGAYLPIGWLVRRFLRIHWLSMLWDLNIPLNLLDSRVYFARPIRSGS
jgi:FMN phosphatase YigB (HAD superfamily)/2-polyprenyl-3-methyl-5-hydroxy-6-metoxy-1,4-benzoquinol methylase